MMIFILSIISFFFLFFLSRKLTSSLFSLFSILTQSKKVSMHLLSFLLLPGIAIHEFAHLIMATILHVHTGKLTLTPEFDERGGIRAGSVRIARSDPFRGTLIGLAPVIVGLALLAAIGHFFQLQGQALSFEFQERTLICKQPIMQFPFIPNSCFLILVSYFLLLFEIGNTMFTSKSDLRDALIVGCFLLGLGFLFHGLGVQISLVLPQTLIQQLQSIAQSISIGLIAAAGIDLTAFAVIRIFIGILRVFRS